jgi:hypothetical protein
MVEEKKTHGLTLKDCPKDLTHDFPSYVCGWFTECGIDVPKDNLIKYSPDKDWLVFLIPWIDHPTVGDDEEEIFISGFVAKSFGNTQAKYYSSAPKYPLYVPSWGYTDTIVLVEDIRSALKLSYHLHERRKGESSLALLGTDWGGKRGLINYLAWLGIKNVHIWLDGDEAGQKGAEKLYNRLKLYFNCRIIKTELDPKWYTPEQIEEILDE